MNVAVYCCEPVCSLENQNVVSSHPEPVENFDLMAVNDAILFDHFWLPHVKMLMKIKLRTWEYYEDIKYSEQIASKQNNN